MIYFDALTESDCEQIRKWRNEDIAGARTPFLLTQDMQRDFYFDEASNRDSKHRFWAIRNEKCTVTNYPDGMSFIQFPKLKGIAGLTNIEWENGRAEIALMIAPDERRHGYGKQAIELLKVWGFGRMRLHTIYANVYGCNQDVGFWHGLKCDFSCDIPDSKWWAGKLWPTYYFQWSDK